MRASTVRWDERNEGIDSSRCLESSLKVLLHGGNREESPIVYQLQKNKQTNVKEKNRQISNVK